MHTPITDGHRYPDCSNLNSASLNRAFPGWLSALNKGRGHRWNSGQVKLGINISPLRNTET